MTTLKRLLIMSCSQRKRSDLGLLPAIERYDGGSYRVLRKAKRDGYWPKNLDVLIVSAKYGLVEASTPIADYEQRMTRNRAAELQPQVSQRLRDLLQANTYDEIYVDLGQDYWPAVQDLECHFGNNSIVYAKGRIGQRLANLKSWLLKYSKEI